MHISKIREMMHGKFQLRVFIFSLSQCLNVRESELKKECGKDLRRLKKPSKVLMLPELFRHCKRLEKQTVHGMEYYPCLITVWKLSRMMSSFKKS